MTWLSAAKEAGNVKVQAIFYDHIISKAIVGKDEDWKDFINRDSKVCVDLYGNNLNF